MKVKYLVIALFFVPVIFSSIAKGGSAIGIPVHAIRCEGQWTKKDPAKLLVFLLHKSNEIRFRLSLDESNTEIGLCRFLYPDQVGTTENTFLSCNIGREKMTNFNAKVTRVSENQAKLRWIQNGKNNSASFSFNESQFKLDSVFRLNLDERANDYTEWRRIVPCR